MKQEKRNSGGKGTNEIIRVKRLPSNFVQMHKGFFDDHRLSFKAKGILGYLLTKPDNWEVRITDLMNHAKDGRDSIYAGLAELKACGYYHKTQVRGENGRLCHWESLVCEVPMMSDNSPCTENPDTAKPETDMPYPVNPTLSNNNPSKMDLPKMNLPQNYSSDNEWSKYEPTHTNAPSPAPPAKINHGEAVSAGAGDKIQYAEFVSMRGDEYNALVTKLGEDGARWCIEKLDNYKGSTGKKYDNDYRTILSWVVVRYREFLQAQETKNRAKNQAHSRDVGGYARTTAISHSDANSGDAFEDYVHKKIKEATEYGSTQSTYDC